MADLADGESVAMPGSGTRPYLLKNVGGVYSCSCPAWRHQSLPIERRTCKHIRRLRGDMAEAARVGGTLPAPTPTVAVTPPPLLLAESWDGDADPTGWWLSEKLDGVRAYWTGRQFLSRNGNVYHAPAWFTAGLPPVPLDGELWLGRKKFQRTVGIVRRQDQTELWREVQYLVFDAPDPEALFEDRLRTVNRLLRTKPSPYARPHAHLACAGVDHLRRVLAQVEALGGEGLMLRRPGSRYEAGRSATLQKVKTFHDAEARVVGHELGRGRHAGRLGALLVERPDGTRFAVGTGLSDSERSSPPPVGGTITYRHQELTDGGVPRFPVFVGRCSDVTGAALFPNLTTGVPSIPSPVITTRRFTFVGGGSDKFWEVGVRGPEVTVRFGRTGTNGQATTKTFPDEATARRHADKLVREKTGKGYVEAR